MGLVVTSQKMSIFMLVTMTSPVCTYCIIDLIRMHGHTPGTNTVLLIAKMIGFVADENSLRCPYGTYHYTFVCTFQYECNTPCGGNSGDLTSRCWSPRAVHAPVPNSPTQFQMHANRPGCAMGLVVTSQKMSIFMLVTTTSPVCTYCIIDLIRMHEHTPGTNTVLLIAKMIGFVADENSLRCPYGT